MEAEKKIFKKPGQHKYRVCDVGTGAGWFCSALEKKNPQWLAYGAEICEGARSSAEQLFGPERIKDSISHFSEEFDAITFFDVLEHLVNPLGVLKNARAKLKKGGMILCINPGWNIWDTLSLRLPSSIGGKLITKRLSVAHVSVFSPNSVQTLMHLSGFKVLAIKRFVDIGNSFSLFHRDMPDKILREMLTILSKINFIPANRLMVVAVKM